MEANPQKWTADELANELGPWLTFAVRQSLGLTTIGSIDVDKAGRKERRNELKKQRETNRRREQGSVSRAEYEANSKSRTKPWKPLRMSRAKYYKLGLHKTMSPASETSPCPAKRVNVLVDTHLSHVELPTIDLRAFGIVAITISNGNRVVRRWQRDAVD